MRREQHRFHDKLNALLKREHSQARISRALCLTFPQFLNWLIAFILSNVVPGTNYVVHTKYTLSFFANPPQQAHTPQFINITNVTKGSLSSSWRTSLGTGDPQPCWLETRSRFSVWTQCYKRAGRTQCIIKSISCQKHESMKPKNTSYFLFTSFVQISPPITRYGISNRKYLRSHYAYNTLTYGVQSTTCNSSPSYLVESVGTVRAHQQ